ncbi:MAG: BTAD domain-containing putative transcriptional regulator [Jatrophihabitantaceae bacterium]
MHLGAREERAALRLRLDEPARAEADLTTLCGQHPDREHSWALLIGALARAGRPGDVAIQLAGLSAGGSHAPLVVKSW